jgi:acetyl-CoA synthetase
MRHCGVASFAELHRRSVDDVAWFTEHLLRFLDVNFNPPYTTVCDVSRGIEWARWCVGGGLNIATRCLDYRLATRADQPAILWEGEEGQQRSLSYLELHNEVERCATGLRDLGIGKGDAIGLYLPMMPETVVALLAIARIGAIAVPVFSGYGPAAIATRLRDVEAKVLVTCDAFPRRGKTVAAKSVADEAVRNCPAIRHVVVVERYATLRDLNPVRDVSWHKMLSRGAAALQRNQCAGAATRTLAEDPLIILYTSGTTGKPKGIVHSHCGFPIKSAQDMAFGTDVGPGTRISWVTDIGWMMGPWLIYGALILGATVVLYDGAPDYPGPGRMWEFCARHNVEVLGISPSLVRALATQGDDLPAHHDLSSLRILASTGEPWTPDAWWWLFKNVGGGKLPIINYSGGTEISGSILMNNPLLPINPCAFSAPCPGIAADVLDENGQSVRGSVGELVIKQPWIGMARGFWRDPERYLETYWRRWPGVWVHGDWASIDDDGHWFIHGRSDDTLKIAGKRVGPAEVEAILAANAAVMEAAVIAVPDAMKGSKMLGFCVLSQPDQAGDELATVLCDPVAVALGKPLRPHSVHFVPSLPKTRNAKTMRRLIRAAYLGEDLGDLSALENPASIAAIQALA